MVLKCIWIIELNWMGKYGKKKMQKSPHSGHFLGSSLGTGIALVFYFDQFSYFDHNLLISAPI